MAQCISEEAQSKTPTPTPQEEEEMDTSPANDQEKEQQTTTVISNSAPSSSHVDDTNNGRAMHKRLLGKPLDVGLLGDIFSKFVVKRNTQPPLIPLCRLISNESIRTVSTQVEIF